jgi:1-deoxy-D-xylulose-5-phosphate reductoisomerase
LVEWRDGALTAGLGSPDMRIPSRIASRRARLAIPARRLDLAAIGRLTFEKPDQERFPCLALARAALRQGGAMPTGSQRRERVAVAAFIAGEVGFLDIARLVAEACESGASKHSKAPSSIDEALAIDEEVRRRTQNRLAA